MNYVQDNMFLGQLPKRLVIACVDSDALNGAIGNNPFDFKHYKINFVALNVDGRQIPTKPLQPDFKNNGLYLSHIRSHFLYLDFIIGRVCHESKSVPTSSQFNFQIHVVE
jgi:hypothetical protein